MSEATVVVNPNEQYTQPPKPLAAETVFENVYSRTYGYPAIPFVQKHFEAAEHNRESLEAKPTGHRYDFRDRFTQEAITEAKSTYSDRPHAIGQRVEHAKRMISGFMDLATALHANDKVDPPTVNLFFDMIEHIDNDLDAGYRTLVSKTDEPRLSYESRSRYKQVVIGLFADHSDIQRKTDDNPFLNINGYRYQDSGTYTTERYYISPKLNDRPEEVVRLWTETLTDMGLDETLCYKVDTNLDLGRYDTVVAYASPQTSHVMQTALEAFYQRCPSELLSDTPMPSGIELAKGISAAPEPAALNALLEYRGKERVSYNQLVCGLTELALRRASYDFIQKGIEPGAVTPEDLREAAKPYFVQFVRLSSINPVTMKVITR